MIKSINNYKKIVKEKEMFFCKKSVIKEKRAGILSLDLYNC